MDALIHRLRKYTSEHSRDDEGDETNVQIRAMEIVEQRREEVEKRKQLLRRQTGKENECASRDAIPKFFFGKKSKTSSTLKGVNSEGDASSSPAHHETPTERCIRLFQELAYSRAVHFLQEDVIPEAEATISSVIMALEDALREEGGSTNDVDFQVDYDLFHTLGDQFISSGQEGSEQFRQYFTATVFLQLASEGSETVALSSLRDYMIQHQRYLFAAILLSKIDLQCSTGDGRFSMEAMETFVSTYLDQKHNPRGPRAYQLEAGFVPFYRLMVVRRFFFFLDPNKKGFITMRSLLGSVHFADFIEVCQNFPLASVIPMMWYFHQCFGFDCCNDDAGAISTGFPLHAQ